MSLPETVDMVAKPVIHHIIIVWFFTVSSTLPKTKFIPKTIFTVSVHL